MQLVVLLLLLSTPLFGWELRRKSPPKVKQHKVRKFIQTGNLAHLPKLNRLPKLSKAKSLHVPEKSPFDPCASSTAVCLNGGTCHNKDGSFLCQCPATHYGKKCERLADLRKCAGNRCQHGATCVSLPKSIEILDPVAVANYTVTKSDSEPLPPSQLKKMMIHVSYECICPPGYVGLLCDMLEAELQCQENYCMGRGTANFTGTGCTCDCHSNFIGPRCETENPCKDYECYNSGVCRPVRNRQKGTVEAVCDCPQIEMIGANVTGEQCEILQIAEADYVSNPLVPCKGKSLALKWYKAASNWWYQQRLYRSEAESVELALNGMINGCRNNQGQACTRSELNTMMCFNGGECEARVVAFPGDVGILMPFCKCQGADAGRFCEFQRSDECDPTPEEMADGVTRVSRCTDEQHGTCVVVLGEPKCHCKSGYVGEMCETFDPCADRPCWNSECIPIPSETVVDVVGELKQTYRCLCAMGDEMSGPNKCIFPSTGNCTSPDLCNEGQCITCDHSDEENAFKLCTEEQTKDGFRCLCRPGYAPPYCDRLEEACNNHLCENGGVCQPTSKYNYDCQCNPGTRGTLCEEVTDVCLSVGRHHCQHGDCYQDPAALRGFSCDCETGWYGRDCQFEATAWEELMRILWDEYYFITLPLLAVAVNMVALAAMYFGWTRRETVRAVENKKSATVPSQLSTKKTSKGSVSETKVSVTEKKSSKPSATDTKKDSLV